MSRDLVETLTITLEFTPEDEGSGDGPARMTTDFDGDDVPVHVWATTMARLLSTMSTGGHPERVRADLMQALDAWVLDQTGNEGAEAHEVAAALSETLVHLLGGSRPDGVLDAPVVGAA